MTLSFSLAAALPSLATSSSETLDRAVVVVVEDSVVAAASALEDVGAGAAAEDVGAAETAQDVVAGLPPEALDEVRVVAGDEQVVA